MSSSTSTKAANKRPGGVDSNSIDIATLIWGVGIQVKTQVQCEVDIRSLVGKNHLDEIWGNSNVC